MEDEIEVRVTLSVWLDLWSREIAGEFGIIGKGMNTITRAQAASLADDARWQADPTGPGESNGIGMRSAYARLADRIEAELTA